MEQTICYGEDFLALCERAKRGEIVIYSWSVGRTPAEWIVLWSERKEPLKKAVQQELFGLQTSAPVVTDKS